MKIWDSLGGCTIIGQTARSLGVSHFTNRLRGLGCRAMCLIWVMRFTILMISRWPLWHGEPYMENVSICPISLLPASGHRPQALPCDLSFMRSWQLLLFLLYFSHIFSIHVLKLSLFLYVCLYNWPNSLEFSMWIRRNM